MTEAMATSRIENKKDLDKLLEANPVESSHLEFKYTMDALRQHHRDHRGPSGDQKVGAHQYAQTTVLGVVCRHAQRPGIQACTRQRRPAG